MVTISISRRNIAYRIIFSLFPQDTRQLCWIILKPILNEMGWEGVKWNHLAEGRSQWLPSMNMVINLPWEKMVWYGMVWYVQGRVSPFSSSRHTLSPWLHRSPHLAENGGTITWLRNWRLWWTGNAAILLRGPLGTWGSLTCSKCTTRVKRLKIPPGGLVPWIFPSLKIRWPPSGLNPRHSGHEVGTLPLDHGGRCQRRCSQLGSDH
jgi:hypothetical protein